MAYVVYQSSLHGLFAKYMNPLPQIYLLPQTPPPNPRLDLLQQEQSRPLKMATAHEHNNVPVSLSLRGASRSASPLFMNS